MAYYTLTPCFLISSNPFASLKSLEIPSIYAIEKLLRKIFSNS